MPNTPVFVGEVAAAAALGQKASKEDGELVNALFNSVGYCATVDEKLISAVTGISLDAVPWSAVKFAVCSSSVPSPTDM